MSGRKYAPERPSLNLKAYLFQAVRNRSLSFASRASIYETTEQLPDKPDLEPDEQIALAERDARLWSAIDRLPPNVAASSSSRNATV